jgi:hypothetical protein
MRGMAGPWLIETWMASVRATKPFVALHTSAPSVDDPTATEAVGAWYSRRQISWDALDDTAIANSKIAKWSVMPNITLAGIAVYTTSTGASLMLWCPYASPYTVKAGGAITVGIHELYVEIV